MVKAKKSNQPNTNTVIVLLIVAVLIGWIVGFALGNSLAESEKADQQEIANDESEKEKMAHSHSETVEASSSKPPSVSAVAFKDPKSGYNVRIDTNNFKFSPENASTDHVDGEGHAHIYVNGEKIGRVYGPWVHIDNIAEAENTILVTLNTNNHANYTVDGKNVESSIIIVNDGHSDHTHSESTESHSH